VQLEFAGNGQHAFAHLHCRGRRWRRLVAVHGLVVIAHRMLQNLIALNGALESGRALLHGTSCPAWGKKFAHLPEPHTE
jgi:hypothetical protein